MVFFFLLILYKRLPTFIYFMWISRSISFSPIISICKRSSLRSCRTQSKRASISRCCSICESANSLFAAFNIFQTFFIFFVFPCASSAKELYFSSRSILQIQKLNKKINLFLTSHFSVLQCSLKAWENFFIFNCDK